MTGPTGDHTPQTPAGVACNIQPMDDPYRHGSQRTVLEAVAAQMPNLFNQTNRELGEVLRVELAENALAALGLDGDMLLTDFEAVLAAGFVPQDPQTPAVSPESASDGTGYYRTPVDISDDDISTRLPARAGGLSDTQNPAGAPVPFVDGPLERLKAHFKDEGYGWSSALDEANHVLDIIEAAGLAVAPVDHTGDHTP